MASSLLYAGFDLGTTNSAAAVFDGNDVQVVRNSAGANLTPSVVRLDPRGRATVGQQAYRFVARDPENTAREFKRLMGTTNRITFPASGESRLPHELATMVLAAMRKDVEDVTGVLPARAVVSVPALFELPQSKATAQAAHAAGFEQVELLQEPIASALASGWRSDEPGAWIVYDLGGGTFDVSLLETRDGLLRVVGHDGDNFLGGRDFDRVVVDWLVTRLGEQRGVSIERKDPAHASALRILTHAAEAARIALSREAETTVVLDDPLSVGGREVELEMALSRTTLEELCAPLVTRTLAVCRRLLATHGMAPAQLSHVVLVGGPTVMPYVRREVAGALEARIATGHDPMTLVAQGAAIYAATAGLDARPTTTTVSVPGHRKLWCQYPPVTADLEPHVIGRFEDPAPPGTTVELERDDGWKSEAVTVEEDGSFVHSARLVARRVNRLRVRVRGADGSAIAVEPAEIVIVHGLTIGDPPLSRSIGVALASNTVHTYVERGTALPTRRTFTHHTVETVARGSVDSVLEVPIVQGEYQEANLCQVVGRLSIHGREVKADIPSGSPIEVTLDLDRSGRLAATARITVGGKIQVFEGVAQLVMPEPTPESLDKNLAVARERVADALADAFRSGASNFIVRLQTVDCQLVEVGSLIDAARGGDHDAAQRASRAIRDGDATLAELEAERRWPTFELEARDTHSWAVVAIAQYGHESEQRLADVTGRALERALERRSVPDTNRQLQILNRLGMAAYFRDPECWNNSLRHYLSRLEEASDLRQANKLAARGKKAVERADRTEVRAVVEQLRELFPTDPMTRRMAHESGVR